MRGKVEDGKGKREMEIQKVAGEEWSARKGKEENGR